MKKLMMITILGVCLSSCSSMMEKTGEWFVSYALLSMPLTSYGKCMNMKGYDQLEGHEFSYRYVQNGKTQIRFLFDQDLKDADRKDSAECIAKIFNDKSEFSGRMFLVENEKRRPLKELRVKGKLAELFPFDLLACDSKGAMVDVGSVIFEECDLGICNQPTQMTRSSVDPKQVRKVLFSGLQEFQQCLSSEAKEGDEGRIILIFKFDSKQYPFDIEVRDPRKISDRQCIKRSLKKKKFPKPLGGGVVGVKQPMYFRVKK